MTTTAPARRNWKQTLERFFMLDLLKGFALTFKYTKKVLTEPRGTGGDPLRGAYTEFYPEERPKVSERFRGAPRLNLDPATGDTLCIACNLCALACPENCINVGAVNRVVMEDGKPKKKKVLATYVYDTSRCMFCDLCVEACPTDCIELTQEFELASYNRAGMVWDREQLEKGREIVRYGRQLN
ncbi:NuoI/complex I 23 kDa subunit family protein [Chloracidobacterium thermophilum]|jgi:NADH-quinone oxidoreductase subunit I|uniref:NADH-quinone oxidoreductase subunit I n=1 Tax=Chloracidobacterium thermophilum (strain B) TaxID=981222 RepID=G2LI12_CHLTF|nr:NADH-quinone oxidoreductase subunit I [Chloracidobacterium thermophilum]AEP11228.1 Formate hydrogenlyase subunit 6/NADH:ubiquinone oxidoreductase 23 kD subunit (chain I) [Chloracidobacterium thermophilum B]QUV79135.1 NADH-quinone oxidoreductase subunit I [Chloracidobacterium thermophilum]